jgi:hypothetical protein
MGRLRNKIWTMPDSVIQEILDASESMSDVCRKLGINEGNGSIRTLYRRIGKGFNFDKLKSNYLEFRKVSNRNKRLTHEEIFIENSSIPRKTLRKVIIRDNVLPYMCSGKDCVLVNTWKGLPLSLQIEHKNGINTDHRIENLAFLCPNCHSQTSTYAGRNKLGA